MKEEQKEQLKASHSYRLMQKVTLYMDKYYLDGLSGLVPGGVGDMVTALFALVHIYFCGFKLRSIPLTLAILNNVLRDVLMGLLPFFVGNIIDFINKAHSKNMKLIDGYINDDPDIVHEVRRKAWISAATIVVTIAAIGAMVWFLVWLAQKLGTTLFS